MGKQCKFHSELIREEKICNPSHCQDIFLAIYDEGYPKISVDIVLIVFIKFVYTLDNYGK